MDKFDDIRCKISSRYREFKPNYCFIKSSTGLQMLVHLIKIKIEILINNEETYETIKIKLDSLIIIAKNRKKDIYCQCGYNLTRYDSFTKCKICGLESCTHCFYSSFKINQGVIVCYQCGNHTTKKIKPISTFNRIFNQVLKDYCEETGDASLLELLYV